MKKKKGTFVSACINTLASNKFLYFVIVLFILQSLWIAFSFSSPIPFDEDFHIPFIKALSEAGFLVLGNQPVSFDGFGDVSGGRSVLYHYLMSFPFRVFTMFVSEDMWQVVFLRTINVFLSATGIYIFARLLREAKISQLHINLGLLVFIMLPIVPFVAASVNYDNMLFPLIALYMLYSLRIVRSAKVAWQDYAKVIIVGCLAALVKFTFLPIFATSVIYLIAIGFKRHGRVFLSSLWNNIKTTKSIWQYISYGLLLTLVVGAFSYAYIRPIVLYGSPDPACPKTLSEMRCSVGRHGLLEERSKIARSTINERTVLNPAEFTQRWQQIMFRASVLSASHTVDGRTVDKRGIPIIYSVIYYGVFIGLGILAYSWRSLHKNSGWYYLLAMIVVSILSVYIFNLQSHYATRTLYAANARYLLAMLPVLITMIIVASSYALGRMRNVKLAVFFLTVLLFTQGGGVVTHMLLSDDSWYWQRPKVIEANHIAKDILRPIVKEY